MPVAESATATSTLFLSDATSTCKLTRCFRRGDGVFGMETKLGAGREMGIADGRRQKFEIYKVMVEWLAGRFRNFGFASDCRL